MSIPVGKKAVIQFTLQGDYVNRYQSITEAAKAINKSGQRITDVCKGKQKSTGGFIWMYENSNKGTTTNWGFSDNV